MLAIKEAIAEKEQSHYLKSCTRRNWIKTGRRLSKKRIPDYQREAPTCHRKESSRIAVRHFHEAVKHQGSHFTAGALQ